MPDDSGLPTYDVRLSEAAESDIDALMLRQGANSPDAAARWHDGLLAMFRSLTQLPHRCTLALENDRYDREVRQLFYRQGKAVYRILFMVFEAESDEPGFVRIMPILYGTQRLGQPPTVDDGD